MSLIEKELKDAVWKEGFSLEQNVFRILEKEGWNILPNRYFFDSFTNRTREFDILAYKSTTYRKVTVFTVLIIECKFNPNRIVFYARSLSDEDYPIQYHVGDFMKNLFSQKEINSFFPNLKKYKKFFKSNEQVFGYQTFEMIRDKRKSSSPNIQTSTLSFKSKSELSERLIFPAINTVIQATKFEQNIRDRIGSAGDIIFFFPVVVFSGNLYRANLIGERKTLISQELLRYKIGMTQSNKETPEEFCIHITSMAGLSYLIKAFDYSHKRFSVFLKEKMKK